MLYATYNLSWMNDGRFVPLSRHRLQICSNGGTTVATSGLVRCEAVLHGCGTSPVGIFVHCLHANNIKGPTGMGSHGDFIVLPHSLGHQATSTMTCYPSQSNYPDTDPISVCPILTEPSARLGSDKYQFYHHWFESTRVQTSKVRIPRSPRTEDRCSTHLATPSGLNLSWVFCGTHGLTMGIWL